jgi:hypothetical protein
MLAGERLEARPSGALWWPAARLLAVADMHLGKSARMARRAGLLLPPYETAATLARLAGEIAALDPAVVVALGDSFDDAAAGAELAAADAAEIEALAAGRTWRWIAGNHDPALPGRAARAAWQHGPLVFRHIAAPGASGEISGHYHPKARLAGPARPCFLADAARVILPAFGAYTGGLSCDAPELAALMAPDALAVLTGAAARARPLRVPAPRPRPAFARRLP